MRYLCYHFTVSKTGACYTEIKLMYAFLECTIPSCKSTFFTHAAPGLHINNQPSRIMDPINPLILPLPAVVRALVGATLSSKGACVGWLWFSLFLGGKLSFFNGLLPELDLQIASDTNSNNSDRKKKVILLCLRIKIPKPIFLFDYRGTHSWLQMNR